MERKQKALARYDAALMAANAAAAAKILPLGEVLACQPAFQAVLLPAYAEWDSKVGAAYAAYQEAVQ